MTTEIDITALDNTASRPTKYAHLEVTEDTARQDIERFVNQIIGSADRDCIKLRFSANDDWSGTLIVPLAIPTLPNSDNCDNPIFTVMDESCIDQLVGMVIERIAEAAENMACDNEVNDCDDIAEQFLIIKHTVEDL